MTQSVSVYTICSQSDRYTGMQYSHNYIYKVEKFYAHILLLAQLLAVRDIIHNKFHQDNNITAKNRQQYNIISNNFLLCVLLWLMTISFH